MKFALPDHVLLMVSHRKIWTAPLSLPQGACITSSTWEAVLTSSASSSSTWEMSELYAKALLRLPEDQGIWRQDQWLPCLKKAGGWGGSPGASLLNRIIYLPWRKRGKKEGKEVVSKWTTRRAPSVAYLISHLAFNHFSSLQTPWITSALRLFVALAHYKSYISEPKDELIFYFNVSSKKQITWSMRTKKWKGSFNAVIEKQIFALINILKPMLPWLVPSPFIPHLLSNTVIYCHSFKILTQMTLKQIMYLGQISQLKWR